jgi:hypothetical protein
MNGWLENLSADLRLSARMLWKNPGLTLTTIFILSLGIGGATAVFSYVNAILLKPLPYRRPKRLVMLFENNVQNGWRRVPPAPVIFADWRDHATVFDSLSVRGWGAFILTGSGGSRKPRRRPRIRQHIRDARCQAYSGSGLCARGVNVGKIPRCSGQSQIMATPVWR